MKLFARIGLLATYLMTGAVVSTLAFYPTAAYAQDEGGDEGGDDSGDEGGDESSEDEGGGDDDCGGDEGGGEE